MYNILIVDDEKIERNGIIFLLKRLGIKLNVSEAPNGKAALEYILQQKDNNEKIDILLTDVKMPFMDGIELIRSVKEQGIVMKSIIFSGYNEFEYAKLAVKLGVVDYILKPVNPKEFEDTISKVVHELEVEEMEHEKERTRNSYMKEYLLYSLVSGRSISGANDNAYIQNQLKNTAGDDFWNEYDRIVLIEFNNDIFGREIIDFETDILNEISGITDYQYLNLNQQQAIVMFNDSESLCKSNSDNNQPIDQVVIAAQNIHDYVFEKIGHHCYAAVSDKINDYNEIPHVMDYLEELMQNKFYHPEVHVFTGKSNEREAELVQIDDDTLMKQMKQDIKMKDIEGLKEHFGRISSKYKNQSYFSHIYIKFIFSNLLKDFYNSTPDTNEEDFNKEIEKLYTSEDLDTIIGIINSHIVKLEKAFAINPQMAHREIETVKQYIYEHYGEELGVDQLAAMVYLTPSYLSTVFKKETGQNLSKFIKQYRMERAKDMLENSNKKIVNISNETGYPNVSYFCQSFREYYGVSPQKFRNQGEALDEEN